MSLVNHHLQLPAVHYKCDTQYIEIHYLYHLKTGLAVMQPAIASTLSFCFRLAICTYTYSCNAIDRFIIVAYNTNTDQR